MRVFSKLLLFVLAIALGFACGEAPSALPNNSTDNTVAEWGLLFYGMGDNDLSSHILADVAEMEKFGSTRTIAMVAQYDLDARNSFSPDARVVIPAKGGEAISGLPIAGGIKQPVQTFAELDSGDAETFRNFLRWGVQTLRAHHYALVLSGHGYGFSTKVRRPNAAPTDTDGNRFRFPTGFRYFSFDLNTPPESIDPGKSILTTIELASVLGEFRRAGAPLFEVVVADSCVSQTIENIYALKDSTQYYVASQEAERANGHDYVLTLAALHETSRQLDLQTRELLPFTPERFAQGVVQGYSRLNLKNTQLSAVDVSRLEPVREAINILALEARSHGDVVEKWMRKDATYFGGILAPRIWVDLSRMSHQLEWAGAITAQTGAQVREAVSNAVVISKARGPGSVGTTYGISITFPGFEKVRNPENERSSVEWEIEVELGILESPIHQGPLSDLLNFLHCRGPLGCNFNGETFHYPN